MKFTSYGRYSCFFKQYQCKSLCVRGISSSWPEYNNTSPETSLFCSICISQRSVTTLLYENSSTIRVEFKRIKLFLWLMFLEWFILLGEVVNHVPDPPLLEFGTGWSLSVVYCIFTTIHDKKEVPHGFWVTSSSRFIFIVSHVSWRNTQYTTEYYSVKCDNY